MLTLTRTLQTFPSVTLPSASGGLPVEVALIAQLGPGAGDQLVASASARQRGHAAYIDALDEPSARLGGVDLARGDRTSLYSFSVGPQGHPFHRHAGHRVFTAISGSGGARLRFSTASAEQIDADPRHFVAALRQVDIPADCLFTVRFGGGTWHQFVPRRPQRNHPALFALSCHTDELGGELAPGLRERVLANAADIPSLTELLPARVQALLDDPAFDAEAVPTQALSIDTAAVAGLGAFCRVVRDTLGRLRGTLARRAAPRGFVADNGGGRRVLELDAVPADALLRTELPEAEHADWFALTTAPLEFPATSARRALAAVLDGFLENAPLSVGWMMRIRNVLVRPLGLRTSTLGCPVSSLLAPCAAQHFDGRFPVLAQRVAADDRRAEVILGADDRHLRFRSSVGVELLPDGRAVFTLGTRLQTSNLFGRFYYAAIDQVHRRYISPTMLRLAVDHAVRRLAGQASVAAAGGLAALPLRP